MFNSSKFKENFNIEDCSESEQEETEKKSSN